MWEGKRGRWNETDGVPQENIDDDDDDDDDKKNC